MKPPANSKLEITFYEAYGWNHSIPLGKIELHTINFRHYFGTTKTFPLDPVIRPQGPPPDNSLARFLLLHRCYASLRFSYLDLTMSSLPPTTITTTNSPYMSTSTQNSLSSSLASSGPAPALPPRRSTSTNIESNEPPSYKDAIRDMGPAPPLPPAAHRTNSTTNSATSTTSSTAPPLPPRHSATSSPEPSPLTYSQGGPLITTANDTPAPVTPKQSFFGKIANYFSGGSSKTPVNDSWFQNELQSPNNCASQFENLYVDYEMQGHQARLDSLTYDLKQFVYLYIPGLYSGKNPFSHKEQTTGEPKITRHAKRVDDLKALGLDARLVVVPNDGTVYSNAHLIRVAMEEAWEETQKPLVMIGYSKGGVDTAAAFSVSSPALVSHVRCFITLFSPLKGSHVASDIEDSMLRSVVYMGIKNMMEADTAAMRDLSMEHREQFIRLYPFIEGIPALSLATSVSTGLSKTSPFGPPYNYIKTHYGKESDGLVAAQDAIYPGAHKLLLSGMDHVGPRPEYPVFRNHISFILGVIETALDRTKKQWEDEQSALLRQSDEERLAMEKEPDHISEGDKSLMLEQMHSALSSVERDRQEEKSEDTPEASEVPEEVESDLEEGWLETHPDPDDDFFQENHLQPPQSPPNQSHVALESDPASPPPEVSESPPPKLSQSVHTATVVIEPPSSPSFPPS